MKRHFRILLGLVLLTAFAAAHADSPPVDIHQALAIAEKTLAQRGLANEVYVASASLERAAILSSDKKSYWLVKWSKIVQGDKPGDHEIGMRINMDGTAARLIKPPKGF